MRKVKLEYKLMLAAAGKRFYASYFSTGFDSGDMSLRDPDTGLIFSIRYSWGIPVISN